jgi:hypothetical protein
MKVPLRFRVERPLLVFHSPHRAPTSLRLRGTIGPTKEFYGIRVVAQT